MPIKNIDGILINDMRDDYLITKEWFPNNNHLPNYIIKNQLTWNDTNLIMDSSYFKDEIVLPNIGSIFCNLPLSQSIKLLEFILYNNVKCTLSIGDLLILLFSEVIKNNYILKQNTQSRLDTHLLSIYTGKYYGETLQYLKRINNKYIEEEILYPQYKNWLYSLPCTYFVYNPYTEMITNYGIPVELNLPINIVDESINFNYNISGLYYCKDKILSNIMNMKLQYGVHDLDQYINNGIYKLNKQDLTYSKYQLGE